MKVLPMGPRAVLVEDPRGGPTSWALGFRSLEVAGVVDVVPAARTVLINCRDDASLAGALLSIERVEPEPSVGGDSQTVVIPVRYDGDDLAHVSRAVGLTIDEIISLHTSCVYRSAFCGFAPGFAYLDGLPERLQLPRRDTPRTVVPAGSVAIATTYCAVYPRASPGGWHLLGTTSMAMFEPNKHSPVRLPPGTAVRFEAL